MDNTFHFSWHWLWQQTKHTINWIAILSLYLIVGTMIDITSIAKNHSTQNILALLSCLSAIGLFWWLYRKYKKLLKKNNPNNFGTFKLTKQKILYLILILVVMYSVQLLWSNLIQSNVLSEPANQQAVNSSIRQLPWLNTSYVILVAPLVEELIFRGIFMNYFFNKKNRFNQIASIISSGMVFGFLHTLSFDFNFFFYSILGCILGSTYWYFKDIRYNTTIHFLNNLISSIF